MTFSLTVTTVTPSHSEGPYRRGRFRGRPLGVSPGPGHRGDRNRNRPRTHTVLPDEEGVRGRFSRGADLTRGTLPRSGRRGPRPLPTDGQKILSREWKGLTGTRVSGRGVRVQASASDSKSLGVVGRGRYFRVD